jgi:hypothetical protein
MNDLSRMIPSMLAEQRITNKLLALQCELIIAFLENDVYAADCHHRLERIMAKDTAVSVDGLTELRMAEKR